MPYCTNNIAQHFNRAAGSYDQVASIQQRHIALAAEQLAKRIAPDSLVADIGCGTGEFGKEARRKVHAWNVMGVDIAAAMCEQSKQHQQHTAQGNVQQIPLANNAADTTCCHFTLQWSNDPAGAIAELARITKQGGYIAILSFTSGTLSELGDACEAAGAPNKVNHFHNAEAYADWLSDNNLQCIEQHVTSETSYYKNAMGLFAALKNMGATNSNPSSINGLGNRTILKDISHKYDQKHMTEQGVQASWNIGYWLYQK